MSLSESLPPFVLPTSIILSRSKYIVITKTHLIMISYLHACLNKIITKQMTL